VSRHATLWIEKAKRLACYHLKLCLANDFALRLFEGALVVAIEKLFLLDWTELGDPVLLGFALGSLFVFGSLFLLFPDFFLSDLLFDVFSHLFDLGPCLWAQDDFSSSQLIDESKDGVDKGKDVVGVIEVGKVDVEEEALRGVFLGGVGGSGLGSLVGLIGYGEGAEVGDEGRCCEEGGEGCGGAEMEFEDSLGDVSELGHERKGGWERGVFGRAGEREIPAVVLDSGELGLVYDCPDKVGECCGSVWIEEEVEGDTVTRVVTEVVKLPEGLEEQLERVLPGNEGKDGVEGCQGASAGGEDEKVGWTIGDEARGRSGGGKVAG